MRATSTPPVARSPVWSIGRSWTAPCAHRHAERQPPAVGHPLVGRRAAARSARAGWSCRCSPRPGRSTPERSSSTGEWMAPAHTTTSAASSSSPGVEPHAAGRPPGQQHARRRWRRCARRGWAGRGRGAEVGVGHGDSRWVLVAVARTGATVSPPPSATAAMARLTAPGSVTGRAGSAASTRATAPARSAGRPPRHAPAVVVAGRAPRRHHAVHRRRPAEAPTLQVRLAAPGGARGRPSGRATPGPAPRRRRTGRRRRPAGRRDRLRAAATWRRGSSDRRAATTAPVVPAPTTIDVRPGHVRRAASRAAAPRGGRRRCSAAAASGARLWSSSVIDVLVVLSSNTPAIDTLRNDRRPTSTTPAWHDDHDGGALVVVRPAGAGRWRRGA